MIPSMKSLDPINVANEYDKLRVKDGVIVY